MLIDPWRTIGFSSVLGLLALWSVIGTLGSIPMLKQFDLSLSVDTQMDRVAKSHAKSEQALASGEPSAVLLDRTSKALAANPYNARRWLDYSYAAYKLKQFDLSYKAFMKSMMLVPYDTGMINLRLHLMGALAYKMSVDDRRIVLSNLRWTASVNELALYRAIVPKHTSLERFMRIYFVPMDQHLFVKLINRRNRERERQELYRRIRATKFPRPD